MKNFRCVEDGDWVGELNVLSVEKNQMNENKSKPLLNQGCILACNTKKSDGRVIMDRLILELKKTNSDGIVRKLLGKKYCWRITES